MTNASDNDPANAVLTFWFEDAKPAQWFKRDDAFDTAVRKQFPELHAQAVAGELDDWREAADTALARIIILDQFSRNLYRDDPRAFAADELALTAAREAIACNFDLRYPPERQAFFLMPFMHAEDLAMQEECVELFRNRQPGAANLSYAIEHRDIVKRFGRFPHRNKVLGRKSTPEEMAFLEAGGFNP